MATHSAAETVDDRSGGSGGAEPAQPTVFTTGWCPYCRRLTTGLTAAGVRYREIDIEQVPGAADLVAAVNGGNRTVPTVVFADGSTMTNPPARDVIGKLDDLATATNAATGTVDASATETR